MLTSLTDDKKANKDDLEMKHDTFMSKSQFHHEKMLIFTKSLNFVKKKMLFFFQQKFFILGQKVAILQNLNFPTKL